METLLLIVCNLGSYPDGRTALLDSGAVHCLLGLLDQGELKSESDWFDCLSTLLALSHDGVRFKQLAAGSGAPQIPKKVEMEGPRNMARFLMEMIHPMSGG